MKKQTMTLAGIPAILYGSRSRNVYLYLHGKNGCKEEAERFAATACEAGWQVLAIDLPEHGARKNSPERLLPWVAVPEIEAVYARMKPVWAHIRLYGVSIGAWLAMQALQGDAPEQALLVSPVVDMEALITNMMQYAHVTEEQLQRAGEIPTDLGETLSWPYLCWVREHPLHWHGRTQVLYGDRDALTSRTIASMLLAGKKANQLGHPVVLDPVGAGASRLRTDTAFRLLRDVKFTVIRGNISEIKTLASGAGTTKGVDADVADKVTEENLDSAVAFAKAFAAQTGAVIAITGAIDIVADAEKAYCIRNGNAMMSSITGTGCQLSALTAAFVTATPGHPLEAAAAAVCAMGLAGETAHKRLTPLDGNSTYRNYIIDAIYNMTPDQLEEGANYEVR